MSAADWTFVTRLATIGGVLGLMTTLCSITWALVKGIRSLVSFFERREKQFQRIEEKLDTLISTYMDFTKLVGHLITKFEDKHE